MTGTTATALRAAADRLTWEGALMDHLVASLPADSGERLCPRLAWTVDQVLAHLAAGHAHAATALGSLLAGASPAPLSPREELAAARDRLHDLLVSIQSLGVPGGEQGAAIGEALARSAGHYSEHTWDILEAVPELANDPLLCNWLLFVDYSANA
ncbi:MAG: hypothetical protein WEC33_05625, partial [Dehalococcoidia bacterium]